MIAGHEWRCPKCYRINAAEAKFCTRCGFDPSLEKQNTREHARLETEAADAQARELELERQEEQKKAEDLVRAGRFEEAAQEYERLGDLDKAGECRRMDRTTYVVSANVHVGKDGAINISCPHCGASQPITSKQTNEVTCAYCSKRYVIPEKILKLL